MRLPRVSLRTCGASEIVARHGTRVGVANEVPQQLHRSGASRDGRCATSSTTERALRDLLDERRAYASATRSA